MRNTSVLFFALQIICSAICCGQIRMQVQDDSAHASPLHVSGVMSFDDSASNLTRYSYQIEGSVANVSSRGVVLIAVHFGSSGVNGPALDYTYQKDYFFGSDILQPGKTEGFRSSSIRFGAPTVNGRSVPEDVEAGSVPIAIAQVVFVQFSDGSTWGEADLGRELLAVRHQTLRELHRLERVLAEEGEQALKNNLSKKHDNLLPCIGSLLDRCKDVGSCLADGLRSMIEVARQHEIDMKAKSASDLVR